MFTVRRRTDLLVLAEAMQVEDGITFLWYGKDRPLGLMAKNPDGQVLDALLMPLT